MSSDWRPKRPGARGAKGGKGAKGVLKGVDVQQRRQAHLYLCRSGR